MKRSPMPRKRTTKRRPPPVTCSVRSCKRRPVKGSVRLMCVQHLEQRADRLFSLWVRARDGRCTYPVGTGSSRFLDHPRCEVTEGLQAAHYIGRRNKRVRFDPWNVHALCPKHHVMVDQHGREGAKGVWIRSVISPGRTIELDRISLEPKDRITAALEALSWLEGDEG